MSPAIPCQGPKNAKYEPQRKYVTGLKVAWMLNVQQDVKCSQKKQIGSKSNSEACTDCTRMASKR
jgi:hypothetical protein